MYGNGLYFGGKRIAGVRTIVAESTVVYEYQYDPVVNPAATVQSIIERITPISEALETHKTEMQASLDGINSTIAAQAREIAGKQGALVFDGEYDAETNKAATVQTVIDKLAEVVASAPEDLNTLEEIAAWIAEHPESVAEINALIQANTAKIALNEAAIQANTEKIDGLIACGTEDIGEGVEMTSKVYLVYEE